MGRSVSEDGVALQPAERAHCDILIDVEEVDRTFLQSRNGPLCKEVGGEIGPHPSEASLVHGSAAIALRRPVLDGIGGPALA